MPRLRRGILFQELNGVTDGENGLGGIVRDLASEFFLKCHHQLDCIETVRPEIVDEACILGNLIGLNAEMLHYDLLHTLRDIAHVLVTVP
jgi:hypothetical protein